MSETSTKTNPSRSRGTYDIVLISISAALITVCSWISIPLGPVPFTLQTLGILAVMLAAGGRRGTFAVLIYLLMGACGLPVFAGLKGGFASFAGPTGGFLLGFAVAGLVYWLLDKFFFRQLMTSKMNTYIFGAVNSVIFEVVMYVTGVIWFMVVYAAQTEPVGLAAVMSWCVVPFIVQDIVKLIAAVIIGERAGKLIRD
jgi:biotin transport system substrate-specific component